jgi:hypothetical protein
VTVDESMILDHQQRPATLKVNGVLQNIEGKSVELEVQ